MSETYDVTVLYKGQPVLALNDTGIKALRTSGKYVEGDFTVAYTKPDPGIDTSDATLTSGSQMLDGVTAYADGVKITGTIQTWQPPSVQMISFTIVAQFSSYSETFEAESGMTWAQWVDSTYNTDGYTYTSMNVNAPDIGGGTVRDVSPDDVIVSGTTYTLVRGGND